MPKPDSIDSGVVAKLRSFVAAWKFASKSAKEPSFHQLNAHLRSAGQEQQSAHKDAGLTARDEPSMWSKATAP